MTMRVGKTQHTQRCINKDECFGTLYKGNCRVWFTTVTQASCVEVKLHMIQLMEHDEA